MRYNLLKARIWQPASSMYGARCLSICVFEEGDSMLPARWRISLLLLIYSATVEQDHTHLVLNVLNLIESKSNRGDLVMENLIRWLHNQDDGIECEHDARDRSILGVSGYKWQLMVMDISLRQCSIGVLCRMELPTKTKCGEGPKVQYMTSLSYLTTLIP